jgi:hypothetical protein
VEHLIKFNNYKELARTSHRAHRGSRVRARYGVTGPRGDQYG